jgi:hypothetical protein
MKMSVRGGTRHFGYRAWFHLDLANSFSAIAPLTAHEKSVIFLWGLSPSKIGRIAPYLDTIQALSKARVFLSSENERRLLCMGHTFTANQGNNYNKALNLFFGSWESNPANRGEKCYPRREYLVQMLRIFIPDINECNSILRSSGYTGILWWNCPGFESA